ncbi:MAG: hypothetical protein ABFD89_09205 [Bryobacteraceae bacterium]
MYLAFNKQCDIGELVGVTLSEIKGLEAGSDAVTFAASDGRTWVMAHVQECCECVDVNDVCGDVADLIGSPIISAEESSNSDQGAKNDYYDSYTWTFYRIQTACGLVVIRWYGGSNGYYSESVELYRG